jgi:tRNA A-37 threonylcarbamoyl transferase component Bud32
MELNNLIATSETVDVYRNGDMAIKLFKEGCPKTMALYEALTHARVEETGLRIPKIHEVSVIGSRWAIHMDCIEGKTLAELMKEDKANLDKYINDFVDIQLEIHSKKMPKLSKLKDKLGRQINALDCIDDVKKYELLSRLESMPKHIKLCHGNFIPENIIINENGTYVVDWVAARQGNASADVGKTYLLLCLHMPEVAEKYLNLFCEKTNTSKKYVQDWLPIVAAARLTEEKPEERELLMKWLDVVLYE